MVLRLTSSLAEYIVKRFRESTHRNDYIAPITPNVDIPVSLVTDADRIVDSLVRAYHNTRTVNISAQDLLSALKGNDYGKDEARETMLLSEFFPGDTEVVDTPTLILDRDGIVLAWYLPSVITSDRQAEVMLALEPISTVLQNGYEAKSTGWRDDPALFNPREGLLKGCLNMSPAWFQLGHTGGDHIPEVSATLKANNHMGGGVNWVERNAETNALLAGAMAVMHPELYLAGMSTMVRIPHHANTHGVEEIAEVVGKWESIFSAVSVIINRETPYHRDHNSPGEGHDLLLTFGDYAGAWMSIPTLGKRFNYPPGTLMAFSGYLLRHGVNAVAGNRGCLAYYMRPAVMKWVGIQPPSFTRHEILDAVGQSRNSRRVYSV